MTNEALQASEPRDDEGPRGFGGWLWLPLIQLIAGSVATVIYAVRIMEHPLPATLYQGLSSENRIRTVTASVIIFGGAALIYQLFCLVQFLRERRQAIILMKVLYGLVIALSLIGAVQLALAPELSLAAREQLHGQPTTIGLEKFRIILQILVAGAMFAYFESSKRVKNTFVLGAVILPDGPKGIGGWLLVPLVLLIVWCGGILFAFLKGPPNLPDRINWVFHHGWLAESHLLIQVTIIAYSLYCLVRFLQRKRYVRELMIVFFGILIILMMWFGLHPRPNHPNTLHASLFVSAVWITFIAYFLRSARVKNTFVR